MVEVTTAEIASKLGELRSKLMCFGTREFFTNPWGHLKALSTQTQELFESAAGLPTAKRHEVRALLYDLGTWFVLNDINEADNRPVKEVADYIGRCLMKTNHVFEDRLKNMEIELAAWLPDVLQTEHARGQFNAEASAQWRELREQFREIPAEPYAGSELRVIRNTSPDTSNRWFFRGDSGHGTREQLLHVSKLAGDLLKTHPPPDIEDNILAEPNAEHRWWRYIGDSHNKSAPTDGSWNLLNTTDGNGVPHPILQQQIPNVLAESKRVCDLIVAEFDRSASVQIVGSNTRTEQKSIGDLIQIASNPLGVFAHILKMPVAHAGAPRETGPTYETDHKSATPATGNATPSIGSSNFTESAAYEIEQRGKIATITGFGESVSLELTEGVVRLIAILTKRRVSAFELVRLTSNGVKAHGAVDIDSDRLSERTTVNVETNESPLRDGVSKDVRFEVEKLIEKRNDAEEIGDAAEAKRLTEVIDATLESAIPTLQKAARAIKKSLERTYERLRQDRHGMKLAKHFDKYVERRSKEPDFVYEPDESTGTIFWMQK